MKNYQHILFATDLTAESETVGQKALSLSKINNAKLSIVHVFMQIHLNYLGGEFAVPIEYELDATMQKKVESALEQQAKKLGIPKENQTLEIGFPKAAITELANKIGADLIVVGNHDLQGLNLLFGSTTDSVFHHMNCDVMAVRVPK